jgi:predicted enzyme related to lactoylglutathione lyase
MKAPARPRSAPAGIVALVWCLAAGVFAAEAPPARPPRMPELPPLEAAKGSKRLPGKFVWADLITDDLPAAQRFYGALFGWNFEVVHGGYLLARHEERYLAGILGRPRPKDRPAVPRWLGYISVQDLGRAALVVTNAGGRVVAPREKLPRRGEQAVFADPEGALFGAIRSGSGDPTDFLAEPGEWIWVQLMSRDARTASEFYSRVAGYRIVENTTTNALSDYVLTSQGYARATVRTLPEANRDVPATWLFFVRVARIGDSVARAKELGGSVRLEPKPELLGGRVAVVADPTGAVFGLFEWTDDLVKKGGKP